MSSNININIITDANESVAVGGNADKCVNNRSVVIGYSNLPRDVRHGPYSINIGHNTGRVIGSSSIAIGSNYGTNISQIPNNCIILSAAGPETQVIPSSTGSCHITPIKTGSSTCQLYYNPITYEITQYSNNINKETLNVSGAIDVSGTYTVTQLGNGTFSIANGTNMQIKTIYGPTSPGYYNVTPVGPITYSQDYTLQRVNAMIIDTTRQIMYVGGLFNQINGISVNNIAKYNIATNTWSSLTSGVNGPVYALTIDTTRDMLFIGGDFQVAGGILNNFIAQYNMALNSWEPSLGSGMDNAVLALAIYPTINMMYVGGKFKKANNATNNYIARYNLSTKSWAVAMGAGLDNTVTSFAIDSGKGVLYIGGSFSYANGLANNRIASYNMTPNTWRTALGIGFDNDIWSLVFDDTSNMLYIGGLFTSNLAMYDTVGNKWSTGIFCSGTQNGIYQLTMDTSRKILYIGGVPGTMNGSSFNGLAMYDLVNSKWVNTQGLSFNTPGLTKTGTTKKLKSTNTNGVQTLFYDPKLDCMYISYIGNAYNVNSQLQGPGLCKLNLTPSTTINGSFAYNGKTYSSINLASNAFVECIYKSRGPTWTINRQANITTLQ